jgi:hypothetical protein
MKTKLHRDSCGCAMGAKFLGAALAASLAWYGWHWKALSVWGISWRVMLITFIGAAVGKIVGIAIFRMRASASGNFSSAEI